MELRYLLKQGLLPPGLLLWMILLGWCLRRRYPRLARAALLGGLLGLWLMSLPLVVQQSARWLENQPPLSTAQQADLASQGEVIVVLGAGRERADPGWGTDQPSLLAVERLRYAARLAAQSGLPLLTSGGLHYGQPPSEAALMAEVLARDFAQPARWQEGQSLTTWENAVATAQLLRAEGIQRVVLVTQAWHMPRARWCFEQQGLQVVAAPMGFLGQAHGRPFAGLLPESRALWHSGLLLNEVLGRLSYPWLYAGPSTPQALASSTTR